MLNPVAMHKIMNGDAARHAGAFRELADAAERCNAGTAQAVIGWLSDELEAKSPPNEYVPELILRVRFPRRD